LPLANGLEALVYGKGLMRYHGFAPGSASKRQAFARLGVAAELERWAAII